MKIFSKSFRVTQPLILSIVLVIANATLLQLPLTGMLGYEFAAANGVILFLIGGLFSIHILQIACRNELSLQQIWYRQKKYIVAFIVTPFLIGLLHSIIFSKCPLLNGIFFYLIITLPAYLLGISIAFFSFALSKKYSYLLFVLFFLTVICLPVDELILNPQVFFYNPIIGYFPGTIYDEDIKIGRMLIAYRLLNFALIAVIIFLAQAVRSKKLYAKILSLVFLIFITLTFSILKPSLRLSTDKPTLNRYLRNFIYSNYFIIHFSDQTKSADNSRYAALLHEYYLDQISNEADIQFKQKIDSYIFDDKKQKQELTGAGNANVAKPWLKQIYLNEGSYEETLKHELVHVVAANFGATFLKVADNFNSAMIEGLAVAIDNNYDGMPVHYLAKLAWQAGYRVSIPTLFSGMNFFAHTSSISYIYAGSFIKYLKEKYGIESVKNLYRATDFPKYCRKNLDQLANDYMEFIKNYRIEFNKNQAQLYFGGKTIFKKYCPRFAASQTRTASEYLAQNKFEDALKLFEEIYAYSESYNALIGIVGTLSRQKRFVEAERYLNREIAKFRTSQNYFFLELIFGDLLIETNKYSIAQSEYDSLLTQNPQIEYKNEVLIRKSILNNGIDSLKVYLQMTDIQKLRKLISLNEHEIRYFSIPGIVWLAENTREDITDFLARFKNRFSIKDYETSYAAMMISKYFLRKMDLENAQFFAIKAVQVNLNDDAKHVFIENLRMVNWFKNFSGEIKVN